MNKNRCHVLMAGKQHSVVMHCIAQLAFFSYYLPGLRSFMTIVSYRPVQMLVSKYHRLPRYKADQYDPGINDVSLFTFHYRKTKVSQ